MVSVFLFSTHNFQKNSIAVLQLKEHIKIEGSLTIMNETQKSLILEAATTVVESAKTLQNGAEIGIEAMKNFSRFSASKHSFEVYLLMDASFSTIPEIENFQSTIFEFEEHYVKLRNLIDEKMDAKAAAPSFEALENSFELLKKKLA